jgi:hypothetical protein
MMNKIKLTFLKYNFYLIYPSMYLVFIYYTDNLWVKIKFI